MKIVFVKQSNSYIRPSSPESSF